MTHWSEDRYWTDAADGYSTLREGGVNTVTLDLDAIEQVIYNGDGPAYRLMEAMDSVLKEESDEGFRGAPRLVLALLLRLKEISEAGR